MFHFQQNQRKHWISSYFNGYNFENRAIKIMDEGQLHEPLPLSFNHYSKLKQSWCLILFIFIFLTKRQNKQIIIVILYLRITLCDNFTDYVLSSSELHALYQVTIVSSPPAAGGVLSYISYIGMCRPKGYGF